MDAQSKKNLQATVAQCDRCGACTTVCPLYAVDPIDRATARGKVALTRAILEGILSDDDRRLREAMDYCLLCGACTTVCPSRIMTADTMIELREDLGRRHGVRPHHRLIGRAMASRGLKKAGRPAIALAQRFHLPRLSGGLLPADARPELLKKGPARRPLTPPADARDCSHVQHIGYFQGCAMRLFFPDAAAASVRLLRACGRQVSIPDADCCGLPQEAHGQGQDALELARRNIARFDAFDAIVTDCGSCAATLAGYAERLKEDPRWAERAESLAARIWSLSEFLDAAGYEPTHRPERIVTYHDSCHLNRGHGVKAAPRRLLKKAATFVEMPDADMCCGGAGTFQIDYPKASAAILARKGENARQSGADILVAECPSCLMQLGKCAHPDGLQVMHLSQVL